MNTNDCSLELHALTKLRAAFDSIVAQLLEATDASRTTLRLNLPALGSDTTRPIAEARRPGIVSLLDKVRTNQGAAGTFNFIKQAPRILVQNDTRHPDPDVVPPEQLISEYGTLAQMMAGLFLKGRFVGYLSVHENRGTRDWSERDIAALEVAVQQTLQALVLNMPEAAHPQ